MKWIIAACIFFSPLACAKTESKKSSLLPVSESPAKAKAYIISPKDGDKVKSPVTVVFGLEQMGVAPAGVEKKHTGHHHLIVDGDLPQKGTPIPANETYIHFGGGQTQTTVELKKGKHSLQIVLGDHLHIPHEPMVNSEKINITVTK